MQKNRKGYILLGTNLGNREKQLEIAGFLINEKVGTVSHKSKIYETEPWGAQGQPNFLNQVLEVDTDRSSTEVLELCLEIESKMGRTRTGIYAARIIDIDLLFLGAEVLKEDKLTLPHPRIHLRKFVLEPLSEIAGDLVHPIFEKSIDELLEACEDELAVKVYKPV